MAFNSDNFNLKNWNISIPVDSTGGMTGTAATISNLAGYESKYFYDAPDGAMVFYAPIAGATTSSSYATRSELRELNADGTLARWTLAQGGTMTATLKIDQIPSYLDGRPAKQIIGQIHGKSHELVRLYYQDGSVYFRNDRSGPSNTENSFYLTDSAGNRPQISIGEKFSYMIDAHGDTLTVKVYADGKEYKSVTDINDYWHTDTLYFKAGVYLGVTATPDVNVMQGTGAGQVSFYGLDFSHVAGQGMGGWQVTTPVPTPDPVPEPTPVPPASTTVVNGTAGNDILHADHDKDSTVHGLGGNDKVVGHDGDDKLYGDDGSDTIYGYWGNDAIYGGAGNDVLDGSVGNDILDGGTGADKATGGAGRDVFVMQKGATALTVTDFNATDDQFVLKGFSADELMGAKLAQSSTSVVMTFTDGTKVTFNNATLAKITPQNIMAEIDGKLVTLSTVTAPAPDPDPVPTPTPTPTPTDPMPTATMTGTSGADYLDGVHGKFDNVILGLGGSDTLIGHDGKDQLYGGDGNDTLYGYWGDDKLYGGAGSDKLSGGNGADTFVFKAADVGTGSDTITDFSVTNGDKINVTDVLHGHYDPLHDALANFVQIQTSGKNSILSVDVTGHAGAGGWTQVATLSNVTGLTDEALLAHNGTLIVSS